MSIVIKFYVYVISVALLFTLRQCDAPQAKNTAAQNTGANND